ncbi:MAG: HAMP domain-containing histidine kinase [Acidimicrobiia bacterium]|nr:HAMP domain-containing histidine kinase [Acidimicrobiia bacterium]
MRFRPRRLGLRARITLAFGLGSLLLSVALSTSTWAFTRQSQLNQREAEQLDTVIRNAGSVRRQLAGGARPEGWMRDHLSSLPTAAAGTVLREEVSTSANPPTIATAGTRHSFEDVPRSLRQTLEGGSAATMRYRIADTPMLALGVPLIAEDAIYLELVDLSDLEHSLDLLAAYLAGASGLVTLAGATLGWWASRRTLLPLTDVGLAAHAIASGRLDTRLEAAHDPDLAVLVSSFNEMATALQSRIERDARFASDVSHELRSPLMTLAASAEVLQTRRDELPPRSQSALDLLVDDVNRFQQLVADLLEISRFDSGAAHLQLDPVLLPEFLSRAVALATHETIPVLTDGASTDLIVSVDKRRLAQVVANLIDNARKYAGGATAVRVVHRGDEVDIVVEDRGPGIDEADRARVFDRFSRGAGAGARGSDTGSGLGLALVAEHVALHGGRVSIDDRPDGDSGARFIVTLPAGALDGDDDDGRPEAPDLSLPDLADVAPAPSGAETPGRAP